MSYPKGTNFNRDTPKGHNSLIKEFKILTSALKLCYSSNDILGCKNLQKRWKTIKTELYPEDDPDKKYEERVRQSYLDR